MSEMTPIPSPAKTEHREAARALGYALDLATEPGWLLFADRLTEVLDNREIASVAWATLKSLPPDNAAEVAAAVLGRNGAPLPPWGNLLEDARWWASGASSDELRAFGFAIFEAMQPSEKTDFAEYAKGAS